MILFLSLSFFLLQVELQEASPRLGRVMGVGQEPGSDTIEDTDSVNNAISVSDGLKSDKEGVVKSRSKNTGIELAGEPWPVASNSNVIYSNYVLIALLIFRGEGPSRTRKGN